MHAYSRLPVPHSLVEVFRFGPWPGSLLLAGLIGLLRGTGVLALAAHVALRRRALEQRSSANLLETLLLKP